MVWFGWLPILTGLQNAMPLVGDLEMDIQNRLLSMMVLWLRGADSSSYIRQLMPNQALQLFVCTSRYQLSMSYILFCNSYVRNSLSIASYSQVSQIMCWRC